MSKKTHFPAYDGSGFFEYLLNTRQANKISFTEEGLTIWWSDELDRLSKKQKYEVVKSRLAPKPKKKESI